MLAPSLLLRARRPAGDAGASVVEFVMMSVLLVLLLFSVLEVAFYFYADNIVAAATADAARYAANAGVDPGAGRARAHDLIADGLNDAVADRFACTSTSTVDAASGLPTVTVRCRGTLQMLGAPVPYPHTITVTSTALKEGRQ